MRYRFFFTLSLLLLLSGLAGCDRIEKLVIKDTAIAPGDEAPLKIGFLAVGSRLTYPNAGQIAVSEINASGGLLGRHVELVVGVGLLTPEAAVQSATQMIQEEGIVGLVGPNRSADAIAVGALAAAHQLPMITTTATNPGVTEPSDFVFMAAFTDAYQGAVLARFAAETLALTSVASLTQRGDVYTEGVSTFFRETFSNTGGRILANEFYDLGTRDFSQPLTRIAAVKPEALFIAGWVLDVAVLTEQARELGLQNPAGDPMPFLGTDTWENPLLLKNEAAGIEDSFFTGHFSAETQTPAVQEFVAAYQAAYGELPIGGHAVSYDATKILLEAIQRAGSLEGEAIRSAVAATQDYIGATDISGFDENRHPTKSAVIFRIKNGEKQFYTQVDP